MNIVTKNKPYDYTVLNDDTCLLLSEYPFVEKIKIGSSVLEKEVFCLKIGNGKKKVFINASHHGKEWITSMLVMSMLETLCFLYVNDMSYFHFNTKEILNKSTLYVCPMVNPDGVNLCISGLTDDLAPMTKNRLISYNDGNRDFIGKWQSNIHGVDLNHNYDARFFEGKAHEAQEKIFSPGPTKYSGSHPFSEPETVAISDFTKKICPDICVAYHSQGEEIFYDFMGSIPPGAEKIAKTLADISGYTASKPVGMASFSGYKDWVIEKFNIPAFTIEIGLGENPLPLSQFDDIFEKNLPMLLYLLK